MPPPDSPLDIDRIEAMASAATEGPWVIGDGEQLRTQAPGRQGHECIVIHGWDDGALVGRKEDLAFIALARQAVPALVARIRALEKELGR